jgi:hypothetical protein
MCKLVRLTFFVFIVFLCPDSRPSFAQEDSAIDPWQFPKMRDAKEFQRAW